MIVFNQKGDFSNLTSYLERVKSVIDTSTLDKYGRMGVDALRSVTPVDSGDTANSWRYDIYYNKNESVRIVFSNTNVVDGVPVAILLQYGHGTRNGGFVQGKDYINPAIQPIFDEIAQTAWKEVTKT